jgi:hypothetical protein
MLTDPQTGLAWGLGLPRPRLGAFTVTPPLAAFAVSPP